MPLLEADVEAHALADVLGLDGDEPLRPPNDLAPLRPPGEAARERSHATLHGSDVRVDLAKRLFTPPRSIHFDLDARPVQVWGCHRAAMRDMPVRAFTLALLVGFRPMWWALPVRQAEQIVQAAGGHVVRAGWHG